MQQNNGFRRCKRVIGALAGASLVITALTVSNLPQAAAAPSEPVVTNHGIAEIADAYSGLTAAPDGGTYNVGFQTVSDTNRALLVTKTTADGALDPNFGEGGRAVIDLVGTFHEAVTSTPGSKETGRGVAVDKLGRILVLGEVEGDQSSAATAVDTDLFVARLHPNGKLDTSYGTNDGWTRINLSDGANPNPEASRVPDAAGYDIFVRPNQKTVFSAAIGTDSGATRKYRDAAAVQLNVNGTLDTSFGKDGIASISTPFSDNVRRGLVDSDGSYFITAYASVGASNQPFISKFDDSGKPDKSWGDDGLATAYPGGLGGFAEAYGIKKDADGNYLISAYGYRGGRTGAEADNSVDALIFSLKPDGSLNRDWADRGLVAYHVGENGNSSADRHRNITILPDGRIVGVGSSGVTGSINALVTVTAPDGTPGTAYSVDLGATDDVLWGVTTVGNGYQVVAAGVGNSDAKLVTLDLTPASSTTSLTVTRQATTFGGANTATVRIRVGNAATAGKVAIKVDGKALQTVSVGSSGTANVTLPKTLAVGKHTITANLTATPGVAGSQASASVNVTKAASKTSVKLSATKIKKSKRATATIKVNGSGVPSGYYPTGTVTIHDGSKKIASVKVTSGSKGTVKVKLPKITKKGSHTIKASYAGNAQLKASSAKAKLKVTK